MHHTVELSPAQLAILATRRALVVYASRHGQARKVAEHLAAALRNRGLSVDLCNVEQREPAPVVSDYQVAVLVASVHAGRTQSEMVEFARAHREALEHMVTGFVCVSLSRAIEKLGKSAASRARAASEVARAIDGFVAETGWRPKVVEPVAGALRYREYGLIMRLMMRALARSGELDTDTTRDYEYTDWPELTQFAATLAQAFPAAHPDVGEKR